MNNFSKLASIDVSGMTDKKQNLSYLSWPHAVNALMSHDPSANWTFHDPVMYGETMMVSCTVTAFNKPICMHLPVMDHRNQAVKNPDAVIVNKNMMRCLVKAIACHGLGLEVYAGEDLPSFPDPETGEVPPPKKVETFPPPPKEGEVPPAPPPKEVRKPPAKIEGKEGEYQLTITTDPDATEEDWFNIVMEAAALQLSYATKEEQVVLIYNKNRNIFERVQKMPGDAFDKVKKLFADAKKRVNTKEEA